VLVSLDVLFSFSEAAATAPQAVCLPSAA